MLLVVGDGGVRVLVGLGLSGDAGGETGWWWC